MKFFIDTADIEEIKALSKVGLVDGVTTNPSLIYKSGKDFKKVIKEIADIVSGPISAEVTSTVSDEMINQGVELSIFKDIPRKEFHLSVEIETPIEEDKKIKLPQIVNLTSTGGEVFLNAKIHGVIPKKSNKTKSKREIPNFEAEHEIILKYTKEKARRFALITGDVNPVHLSSIIAKIFGFKSSIMHGFGILSDIFEEIEDSYGRIETIKISFIKPVILNSKTLLEIESKQNNKPTKFKLSTNGHLNVIGEFTLHQK